MNRNILKAIVPILAIAFASFTTPRIVCVYFIYIGVGVQTNMSNYSQQTVQPQTVQGTAVLYWLRVCDDNGIITITEFLAVFDFYDTNDDGTLDDESEIAGELEKKEA